MKTTYCILLILIFLVSNSAFGQDQNAIIKSKIEILYKNGDVKAINKLLNEEKSLEPQYILEKLNQNIQYSKKQDNQLLLSKTLLTLGNFWHKQANKIKAFENYLEAETIARNIGEKKVLANSLMNKSTLLDNAIEKINTLNEASEIFESIKDTLSLMKVNMNIGAAYGTMYEAENRVVDSNYSSSEIAQFKKKSFEYYKKVEEINKRNNDKELEAVLYVYYGEWYKYEKDYENAILYFNKAKEILINSKNSKAHTYSILKLAQIANEQTEYSQSLNLLKESEKLAEKYQFNDYLALIYGEYIKVYSNLNDYKSALEFSEKLNLKNIELTEQSNNDKMQILELEKNITENKLQINQYEANSKLNRVLIIASLLIALFIGGISYLVIKNNKRKINSIEQNKIITELEKSAVEIKLKNQLLEDGLLKEKVKYSQNNLITFANQVTKIDTFLDDLKTEMKGNLSSEEKKEKMNSLKISFSEVLNNQNELQQINSLSSELNQEFFFHIRKNYSAITKEDEQLLSYLILNRSNKEISEKLNISIKSLYTKRYRLRKKLNLEENEKLLDFYKKVVDEFVA